ncbi:MAG: hypothetical protein NTY19_47300 [Planctomycetota bacterium]|nr:hypothetical protein [Planctomycetota bacterium]
MVESEGGNYLLYLFHDGAGIYITFCKRIVLRGNFIYDSIDTGGYGASAYYLDEQAEDCLVEDNLSVRVARPSHNHMARKNTLRNNVFVCAGDATLTFPRSCSQETTEFLAIISPCTTACAGKPAVPHYVPLGRNRNAVKCSQCRHPRMPPACRGHRTPRISLLDFRNVPIKAVDYFCPSAT